MKFSKSEELNVEMKLTKKIYNSQQQQLQMIWRVRHILLEGICNQMTL